MHFLHKPAGTALSQWHSLSGAVYLHTLSVPCIFQSVHFSDIADAPALAIRDFPKYLHNYN